jgi:glycosyltransferase involved in cell wall biosynthesis
MDMSDRREWPSVTICILSFNRLKYLTETLDSFRQCCTYPNLEYVIVDNGSDPETVQYINSLSYIDEKIINKTNMGIGHAMNQARRTATGEYFFNLENDFHFFYRGDWMQRAVLSFERDQRGEDIVKEPLDLPLGLVKFELKAGTKIYSNRPSLMSRSAFQDVGEFFQYGREYRYVSEDVHKMEREYINRFGAKYSIALSETPPVIHIGGYTTNPNYGNKGRKSFKELDELLKGKWKNGKWWLTYNYEKIIKRMKMRSVLKKYRKIEKSLND